MVIAALIVFGLCFGSFVNALVYRIRAQAELETKKFKKKSKASSVKAKQQHAKLSIVSGRSMCPNCQHELAAIDLIPVASWLMLRGKCRYCKKAILDNPLVELMMPILFVVSYLNWPSNLLLSKTCSSSKLFQGASSYADLYFVLWLIILIGLVALFVYDLKWMLLPDRIIYPLTVIAIAMAAITVRTSISPNKALLNEALAVVVGGGLFYLIFQLSKGQWIGGGDVKLGWLLGLIVATPGRALLFIFAGSIIGSIVSIPLLATKKLKHTSTIPFGPFLIVGAIVAQLYGASILNWYSHSLLMMP